MAIKSYDVKYLDSVATNIGTMFEYAVACGYEPKVYWNMFVSSEVAKQIEKGNPRFLVGYSAIDLLDHVVNTTASNDRLLAPKPFFNRSEFYWAGWALAQYQNYKATSFFNISKAFPIENVLALYDTLHEADITKFFLLPTNMLMLTKKKQILKEYALRQGYLKNSLLKRQKYLSVIYKCTNNAITILTRRKQTYYLDCLKHLVVI